jgi:ABC-type transport system involved in multi-copper enzyme maturation permease subunit
MWRQSAALALIAAILITASNSSLPYTVLAGLHVVGLAIGSWILRPPGGFKLVGPLCWFDLARLAGRGKTTLLRCCYGLILLAWLWFQLCQRYPMYYGPLARLFDPGPSLDPNQLLRFSLFCVSALTAMQGAAIFTFTPGYVAGAIAEERERGTLDLLFTTPLLDREIVCGKLFGRLAHLACILLTGLPILALTRLWGGVDGAVLLACFIVTTLTLLSVGSISILCSTLAPNVLVAAVSSYLLVIFFGLICLAMPSVSPLTFLTEFTRRFEERMDARQNLITATPPILRTGPPPPLPDSTRIALQMVGESALLHVPIFLGCTALAVTQLRFSPAKPDMGRASAKPVVPDPASWGRSTMSDRPTSRHAGTGGITRPSATTRYCGKRWTTAPWPWRARR